MPNLLKRAANVAKSLKNAALLAVGLTAGATAANAATLDATDASVFNVPAANQVFVNLGTDSVCNDGLCIETSTSSLANYNFGGDIFVGPFGANQNLSISAELPNTAFSFTELVFSQSVSAPTTYGFSADLAQGGVVSGSFDNVSGGNNVIDLSALGLSGQDFSMFSLTTENVSAGFNRISADVFAVNNEMSSVPGPASGILLLSALAGGAAYARRRSSGPAVPAA